MTRDEMRYAIAKQLTHITAVQTNYGPIALDDEAAAIVMRALHDHFKKRLADLDRHEH